MSDQRRLLLIDNYDSFTYNLVQYFQELGAEVVVHRNDKITVSEAQEINPDYLVFSPGPGTVENPEDIGVGEELFAAFRGKIPILGVCLGHQMIGKIFGGTITKVAPVHGKRWPIRILKPEGLFEGLGYRMEGMRYHSLVVDRDNFPEALEITAESIEDNHIMALQKTDEKIYGIQFHPESIGTKTGMQILENFLNI